MKKSSKHVLESFVEGGKQTKSKKPKSLTPRVKASGDKKRAGKFGKSVAY